MWCGGTTGVSSQFDAQDHKKCQIGDKAGGLRTAMCKCSVRGGKTPDRRNSMIHEPGSVMLISA
jgi:hypothetical protein